PVLVAECDQGGGDLVYRLPAEGGGMLNPARGLLSLAATARRGLRPDQIGEHTQRLVGGMDVLAGLTNAEQAQGLTWLWGPLGRCFASLHPIDVLADCGRLGAGGPLNDLLREADMIVLFTRPSLEQVAHLRERVTALASVESRTRPPIGIVVIADPRDYRSSIAEVDRIVTQAELPATVLGGFAYDAKGAEMLRGQWGGRLDRSLLIRSARELAGVLLGRLTVPGSPAAGLPPSVTSAPLVPPAGPRSRQSGPPSPPAGGQPSRSGPLAPPAQPRHAGSPTPPVTPRPTHPEGMAPVTPAPRVEGGR
ncbi:MAG: hypothetical protein QOG99_283, partial [Frankiales bacterium]|nr:hypothetical protein [Frankiales bacterium]